MGTVPIVAVEGGCLCGTVRFRIRLPPKWCAHCHCSMCRRAHGAAFVTWVGSERDGFQLLAGESDLRRYRSSAQATRSSCVRCGTMLFFESGRWPGEVHVTLASLDSDSGLVPEANAYWGNRVAWADFDGEHLPRVEPSTGD
jgi:hypothetical protein